MYTAVECYVKLFYNLPWILRLKKALHPSQDHTP